MAGLVAANGRGAQSRRLDGTGAAASNPVMRLPLVFLDGPWKLAMGLNALESDDWLWRDAGFAAETAERGRLLAEHRNEVLAELPGAAGAVAELVAMVRAFFALAPAAGMLADLARLAQEDFCLLQKQADGQYALTAAILCFPAHWRLGEKLGRPLREIHAPVPGFAARLAGPVDRFLANLAVDVLYTLIDPRMRAGRAKGGDVAVFWEALCLVRRTAFESAGGWGGNFFFGHEGVDLAFRLLDAGWSLVYAPDIEVCHPATTAARHAHHYRLTARNRAWVAKRNLPAPLLPVYLGVWAAATVARVRDPRFVATWFRGLAEGLRTDAGPRRPISWATVARMTRLGRPPVW